MKWLVNMGFSVTFLVGNSVLSVGFKRRPTIISTWEALKNHTISRFIEEVDNDTEEILEPKHSLSRSNISTKQT